MTGRDTSTWGPIATSDMFLGRVIGRITSSIGYAALFFGGGGATVVMLGPSMPIAFGAPGFSSVPTMSFGGASSGFGAALPLPPPAAEPVPPPAAPPAAASGLVASFFGSFFASFFESFFGSFFAFGSFLASFGASFVVSGAAATMVAEANTATVNVDTRWRRDMWRRYT